jgi:hypothetical protein
MTRYSLDVLVTLVVRAQAFPNVSTIQSKNTCCRKVDEYVQIFTSDQVGTERKPRLAPLRLLVFNELLHQNVREVPLWPC